ncbi:hypothetical protein GQ53DRAFT_769368 [Thozetella sp. PMI_491]|nr:hypothetical protein GQ53DRAFT_769368 [Thozetella sp. PMI_491]
MAPGISTPDAANPAQPFGASGSSLNGASPLNTFGEFILSVIVDGLESRCGSASYKGNHEPALLETIGRRLVAAHQHLNTESIENESHTKANYQISRKDTSLLASTAVKKEPNSSSQEEDEDEAEAQQHMSWTPDHAPLSVPFRADNGDVISRAHNREHLIPTELLQAFYHLDRNAMTSDQFCEICNWMWRVWKPKATPTRQRWYRNALVRQRNTSRSLGVREMETIRSMNKGQVPMALDTIFSRSQHGLKWIEARGCTPLKAARFRRRAANGAVQKLKPRLSRSTRSKSNGSTASKAYKRAKAQTKSAEDPDTDSVLESTANSSEGEEDVGFSPSSGGSGDGSEIEAP